MEPNYNLMEQTMGANYNLMEQTMGATTLGVDSLINSSFSASGMNQPRRTTTA